MWPEVLARRLGIQYPIILAPMAGGPSTPELVAAVSEAGGLGSLAAGYLTPEAMRAAIRDVRARTRRPFAVNLLIPDPSLQPPSAEEVAAASAAMEPLRRELKLDRPPKIRPVPDFGAQLAALKEERVSVFSFTFGSLDAPIIRELHDLGMAVLGTATTVQEARLLEAAGVDAVVAQGSEAGGHRGTFAAPFPGAGWHHGARPADLRCRPGARGGGWRNHGRLRARWPLPRPGAAAVQLGTAFLATPESGAHALHKKALLTRYQADPTRLTAAITGKPVRTLSNRLVTEMEKGGFTLPYPFQGSLGADIRQAALQQERPELAAMLAGQGAPLAVAKPAAQLFRDMVTEAEQVAARLSVGAVGAN